MHVLIATVAKSTPWYDASWWTAFGGIASLLAIVAGDRLLRTQHTSEANEAGREAREDRRHLRLERVAELLSSMNLIANAGEPYRASYLPGCTADRLQLLHVLDVLAVIGGSDLPACRKIAQWPKVIDEKNDGTFGAAFAEVRAAQLA
jgi:hypothetical protein